MFTGPNIITDGLVLHLDAANTKSYPGSGTVWKDLSGQGNDGTLVNGPTFDSANNGSIVFDGVDDSNNIDITNTPPFSSITILCWYYSNISTNTALWRYYPANLHFRGAGFYLYGSSGVNSGYLNWDNLPEANKWNMLSATWDGTSMKLYINGEKQNTELSYSGGPDGLLRDNGVFQIGGYFNSTQPWTNGKLSIATLYNRALTTTEILQNYNATKSRFGL